MDNKAKIIKQTFRNEGGKFGSDGEWKSWWRLIIKKIQGDWITHEASKLYQCVLYCVKGVTTSYSVVACWSLHQNHFNDKNCT